MTLDRQQGMWLVRGLLAAAAGGVVVVACGPGPDTGRNGETQDPTTSGLRGELIVPLVIRTGAPPAPTAESAPIARLPAVLATPVPAATDAQTGSKTNEVLKLGFDTLSSYPYRVQVGYPDPNSRRPGLVTEDEIPLLIRGFDGRRVAVSGYIMPTRTQGRGLTQFLLARDQLSCCFGPSPLMNHWIHVTVPHGAAHPNIARPATVTGTLRVGELKKYGSIQSIYRLEAERVGVLPEAPRNLSASPQP